MKQLAALSDKSINYVRNALDIMVSDCENEYPVMESTLTKSGVATERQLKQLEEAGHIMSIEVDVPSMLMPGKLVKMKAYYTERRIPKLAYGVMQSN
jgi:hypothetical protein